MKKTLPILFFGILFGLFFLFVFYSPDPDGGASEKRNLAEMPSFSFGEYGVFPSAFESFVNDHFPFRSKLIRLYSLFEYKVFGEFEDSNVLVGKNDWFFYNPRTADEKNAIKDYKGVQMPDDSALEELCVELLRFRNLLSKDGIEFVVFISPNKANLYSEYVPEYVLRTDERNRADVSVAYIREHTDINIMYPKAELLTGKSDAMLYYTKDDHWNEYGAWIGANVYLRNMLGVEIPFPGFEFYSDTSGELADMVNLDGQVTEANKTRFVNDPLPEYTIQQNWGRWTNREYIPENGKGQKLFVIGDSFGEAFVPYLTPYYSQISFRRFDIDYEYSMIQSAEPDVVLLELTERFFTPDKVYDTLQTDHKREGLVY